MNNFTTFCQYPYVTQYRNFYSSNFVKFSTTYYLGTVRLPADISSGSLRDQTRTTTPGKRIKDFELLAYLSSPEFNDSRKRRRL